MYVVRALKPLISIQNLQDKKAFSALALFYIRDKSYFRFWPHKKFYQKHH